MDITSNFKNIKIYYNKFIKLPITYKILSSVLVSLLIHISFSLLFYLGLYFYAKEYSIPYETIDIFNINLLMVPFYFDIFVNVLGMISVLLLAILLLFIVEYNFIRNIKNKNYNSYFMKKMYKSMRNDIGLKRFNRQQIVIFLKLIIVLIVIIFLTFFIILVSFFPLLLLYFVIPIIIAFFMMLDLDRFNLKNMLLILILFITLATLKALRAQGVKNYLQETNLGGEIPISIKMDKNFYDGYLVLMTKETLYLLNKNKKFLISICRKNIKQINYAGKNYIPNNKFHPEEKMANTKFKDFNFTILHSLD